MTTASRRIGAAALVLLPGLLLAGCSATPSTTGTGSGAQASAKAVASAIASAQGKTTAPKASGPITTGAQACALVSVADAQAAEGGTPAITEQTATSGLDNVPGCGFTSADHASVILSVYLYPLKANPFDGTKPVMAGGTLTAVPGVGDKAGVNKDEFDALKGDTIVSVESVGTKDISEQNLIALGKLFVARL